MFKKVNGTNRAIFWPVQDSVFYALALRVLLKINFSLVKFLFMFYDIALYPSALIARNSIISVV